MFKRKLFSLARRQLGVHPVSGTFSGENQWPAVMYVEHAGIAGRGDDRETIAVSLFQHTAPLKLA